MMLVVGVDVETTGVRMVVVGVDAKTSFVEDVTLPNVVPMLNN